MELFSNEDCRKIVTKRLGSSDFEVLSHELKFCEEAGSGFIGASRILEVVLRRDGKIERLRFFTKTVPVNEFHRRNVLISRVFYKEAEFYRSIWPKLSKYTSYKIAPVCYHSDPNKLLVFENLVEDGYRNTDPKMFLDLEHCEAILERLASFHAATFLFEKEANATIDQMYPELMCDQISWFKNEKGQPGYEHCQTGVRALGALLDKYFSHVSEDVRTKVKNMLAANPSYLLPSTRFRNVLTHSDVWSENFMFKYGEDRRILDCVLLDYQLFGYCPPSHDVYAMIFISTDKSFRAQNGRRLARFWYERFRKEVVARGEDPDGFLTWDEFEESVCEAIPLALSNAAIFLHYTQLPRELLAQVFGDIEKTEKFMRDDRSAYVIKAMETDQVYRDRVTTALQDCIDYIEGKLVY